MPRNGTRYSGADSRNDNNNFIWTDRILDRILDIELVGGHIKIESILKYYTLKKFQPVTLRIPEKAVHLGQWSRGQVSF